MDEAARRILDLCAGSGRALVVTLNPEIVVRAEREPRLARAIARADLCVADGVGVVWAARRTGTALPGRVPGVELAMEAMRRGGDGLRVYFLGARRGIARRAADEAARRYGVRIAGVRDGYFAEEEVSEVVAEVRRARPDLLLAGLGERQEVFLAEHLEELGASAAMGVGGTLDVLAGAVRRTPGWTRRLGVEWAWRVGSDPTRWHRAPRLARFAWRVLKGR